MHKYKPISKSWLNKDQRRQQEKERKLSLSCVATDSDEQSSEQLQQIEFNCYSNRQQQSHSIQEFIENLQTQNSSQFNECHHYLEIEQIHGHFYSNSHYLDKINADFMSKMLQCDQTPSQKVSSIKFDSTIRIKFFDGDNPVSQISDTQQYKTTIQYQLPDQQKL